MRPRLLDLFCGEGGAGQGYANAGFEVVGVDTSAARLKHYPFESHRGDAIEFVLEHGHEFDAIHASPTCTGYSRGTAAIPDRVSRYPRLIGATREALLMVGKAFVIENVADARSELRNPVLLCGRQFNLHADDDDGTSLVMDRHRLFECRGFMPLVSEHVPHGWNTAIGQVERLAGIRVAGSYGGARRDKWEAKHVRKGGYVPSARVQAELLGIEWMTEVGLRLSLPPVFTQFIGEQLLEQIGSVAA